MDVQQFWRDGYAIERGVFSPDEVQQWRERALELGPRPSDLLTDAVLGEIVLDPRLISRAAAILEDQPVYFGDSVAAIGGPSIGGFHKDCSDRYDGSAPDWQVERYPTIRFGIYTQPHAGLPGGLDLRRGSHNHPDIATGEWVYADTQPGDLVVWNGRTTHSGPSAMLKTGQRVQPNGIVWRALVRSSPKLFLIRHPQQRVALFATYGIKHALLDRHIAYLRTRTYAVESWRASSWDSEVFKIAAARGLALIGKEDRLNGVGVTNDEYKQLATDPRAAAGSAAV